MDYIKMHGKVYHSLTYAEAEYPEIAKHKDGFPVPNVAQALGLSCFPQQGDYWFERIDKIANFYINFDHGYAYDDFRVPTPDRWFRFQDACPKGTQMMEWLSLVSEFGTIKLDVFGGRIASAIAIEHATQKAAEIAESIKQKPA